MYLMELYLQCLVFFLFVFLFLFFFFRIHDFKKPYITSFNKKKKALIEKGRPKVRRPCLIAENR